MSTSLIFPSSVVDQAAENSAAFQKAEQSLNNVSYTVEASNGNFDNNRINKLNDTLLFNIINPLASIVNINLFGYDSSLPLNPPPSVFTALVPTNVLPTQSAFCPVNDFIYTVNRVGNTITVINCATATVVTTILMPALFRPWAIAYCPVNNQMYVGAFASAQVIRIDCVTNTITGVPIVTTVIPQELGLTYNSVNNSMYMVGNAGAVMNEISCVTNLAADFVIPGVNLQRSAFNPNNNRLYVTDGVTNNVEVIDCATNLPVISIPTALTGSRGIDYCSFNNSVYAVGSTSNTVIPIDCTTNVPGVAIPVIGVSPQDIAYNPLNNLMYVANAASNDFVIINCITNSPSAPIALAGLTPGDVVYNSNDNSIWFSYKGSANVQGFIPISPPSAIITMSNGVTPAQLFNDLQGKPLLLKGMKMIVDNIAQLSNNISISYVSVFGRVDANQFQPLNYVSPTNKTSLVIDSPDFEAVVDGNTDITLNIQPLSSLLIQFTINKAVDNTTPLIDIFSKDGMPGVDSTTNTRKSGNPIYDMAIEMQVKEILECGFNSVFNSVVSYAVQPRDTGNDIADIQLHRMAQALPASEVKQIES